MSAALVQIVAYGIQDVFLTGNSSVTFFKAMYRRHTNFATETDKLTLNSLRTGSGVTQIMTRNADLATKCNLHIGLAEQTAQTLGSGVTDIAYVRNLGHAIINYIDIFIGGNKIDRHYGHWLHVFYELTHKYDQESGYKKLIGDVRALTKVRNVAAAGTNPVLPPYDLYIPLQFWFNRNNGLALPLIALQFHEVKMDIYLNPVNELYVWCGTTGPSAQQLQFNVAELMVDYVYLDQDERQRFAQTAHEYLIEQVQFPNSDTLTGNTSTIVSSYRGKPVFSHPCKEVIFTVQAGAFTGGTSSTFSGSSTFMCYNDTSNDADWNQAVNQAVSNLIETAIKDPNPGAVNEETLNYQTLPYDLILPNGVTALNITLDTTQITDPTTGAQSSITGTPHVFNVPYTLLGTSTYDYMANIQTAYLIVSLVGHPSAFNIASVVCTSVKHSITLTELSVPLTSLTVDHRQMSPLRSANYKEFHVIQPFNYGLDLAGNGNPVSSGNIQFNGKDRFDVQNGQYFNYLQPYYHHTRTPSDGVNSYSFALAPENLQPSGTANMSRIDTVTFVLNVADSLRNQRGYAGPRLDFVTDSCVNIYAINYNILRIMAGLGGVAYAN